MRIFRRIERYEAGAVWGGRDGETLGYLLDASRLAPDTVGVTAMKDGFHVSTHGPGAVALRYDPATGALRPGELDPLARAGWPLLAGVVADEWPALLEAADTHRITLPAPCPECGGPDGTEEVEVGPGGVDPLQVDPCRACRASCWDARELPF